MDEIISMPITQDLLGSGLNYQDGYEEPVEILVKLAQEGEIDPWNIDIVEVTDKFFQQIEEMEHMDLRISGRTLHYAAILLRMKSSALVEEPVIEDDSWVSDFDFLDIEDYPVPKIPIRRHSRRPVTLDELIMELEKAEVVEHRRSLRRDNKKDLDINRHTTEQVLGIAHEEDIEGRVKELQKILKSILKDKNYTTLSELADGDRSYKLMTYISLLFMANTKEIWLEQEELFGELFISYPSEVYS